MVFSSKIDQRENSCRCLIHFVHLQRPANCIIEYKFPWGGGGLEIIHALSFCSAASDAGSLGLLYSRLCFSAPCPGVRKSSICLTLCPASLCPASKSCMVYICISPYEIFYLIFLPSVGVLATKVFMTFDQHTHCKTNMLLQRLAL